MYLPLQLCKGNYDYTPPYLRKDDTIGIICPAGYMPYEKAQTCINTMQQWGFKVKVGKTLGSGSNYFSGTDAERLMDLQQMLDDVNVKAILCARGGYGLSRIIDDIDFKLFNQNPKWIIGYSDVTILHLHIYTKYGVASMHSPMAAPKMNLYSHCAKLLQVNYMITPPIFIY